MRSTALRIKRNLRSVLLLSFVACAHGFGASDETAIKSVLFAQRDAWNRGDLDAFMAGYAHSPDLVFTSGGNIRRGWDETIAKYREKYGSDKSTMGTLSFEILGIQHLGADGAIMLGKWKLTNTINEGSGVFSLGFERGKDGWHVVHDHTSSNSTSRP